MWNVIVALLILSSCRDSPKESGLEETSTPDDTQVETIDADGDGFGADEDCDDSDADVNVGAIEVCDGIDNDCDGLVDDADDPVSGRSTWYQDLDGDGFGNSAVMQGSCDAPVGYVSDDTDCNDLDEDFHPGADESDCADESDYNCDGSVGFADADADGFAACEDCDDSDATISPVGLEVCDGADNNCDGNTDESDAVDASTWFADTDADGYGDADEATEACDAPTGYVADDTDCDDAAANVYPTAAEVCDDIDNDCDGDIDGEDGNLTGSTTFYGDSDGDGYGGSQYQVQDCSAPPGFVANSDDCDDLDASSHPGASEICDDADNDCDGDVDEGVGTTWYEDSDSDGYGNGSVSAVSCDAPGGYVENALDCDDFTSSSNPGSFEVCDGQDNDCDGSVDEDAINATVFYVDADSDGYGSAASSTSACDAPTGFADNDADCNDGDSAVNPSATEICDSTDNDCNGTIDESGASGGLTWYRDLDADGFGNPASDVSACTQPSGYVADATDCDDTSASINTGGTELCDFVDNDCDGTVDEDDAANASTWYADTDSDTYGDPSITITACSAPSGYVADSSDCDDSASGVNPGATENWYDGLDADCAGDNDYDADGDGAQSYQEAGGTDCDDSDANATACGSTAETAMASCNALLSSDSSLGSSTYWIDPDAGSTSNAFQVYCDMTTDGGGWTLCLSNVGRGKGVAISDTNDWWITTWDQGSKNFTRGNRDQGSAWGNFCGDLAATSTEIYATIYAQNNAFTQGDICTFNANWFTAGAGHIALSCGGSTAMSAFPKNSYNTNGCTNCIYWDNETSPNSSGTPWGHNFYGTHVMIKPQGSSAYGPSGIHWGYVNTGMSTGNGGDVHCGEAGSWCYEDYWYGNNAWKKSMQLYLR